GRTIFSTSSGRASVVKSRSLPSRPSNASRTEPPTRARENPASWKRRARSSATGATCSGSFPAERCTWLRTLVSSLAFGTTEKSTWPGEPEAPPLHPPRDTSHRTRTSTTPATRRRTPALQRHSGRVAAARDLGARSAAPPLSAHRYHAGTHIPTTTDDEGRASAWPRRQTSRGRVPHLPAAGCGARGPFSPRRSC